MNTLCEIEADLSQSVAQGGRSTCSTQDSLSPCWSETASVGFMRGIHFGVLVHPGVNLRANLQSTSHRCYPILVAFADELTKETIHLPLGCLQGGVQGYLSQCGAQGGRSTCSTPATCSPAGGRSTKYPEPYPEPSRPALETAS